MLRVAAYCRVSTDKEDQANSFESQKRYFEAWINRNPDWVLQEIYADEGLSGTSTKKRRQFHAMIAAAREGKIDLILTKEVSRFARNTLDTLEYTRELRRRGVGVLFLIDNINTLEQEGELRLTIMSSIAQEESRKTSQRVKWGQTRQMEQGVVFGGSLLGYDVSEGRITVNPEGAETVRQIFFKYLQERKGSSVIARELREEGRLSSRGNLSWSASTVLKILKNEKYCGDLIQKKTYTPDYLTHEKKYNRGQEKLVVLQDHHEAIIDRKTWEAVQQELKRRRRNAAPDRKGGHHYPLSGKLRCGTCGSSFLARKKRDKTGAVYRVWRCGKAVQEGARLYKDAAGTARGCPVGRQLREDRALELLRQALQSIQIDREKVAARLTEIVTDICQDTQGTRRRHLEQQREKMRQKKQRGLEYMLEQIISQEEFRLLNQNWDTRLKELEEQLAAGPSGQEVSCMHAAIQELVCGRGGSTEFWCRLLEEMTVYDDGRVEVALRALPFRWTFFPDGRVKVHDASSVPISVSSACSSG